MEFGLAFLEVNNPLILKLDTLKRNRSSLMESKSLSRLDLGVCSPALPGLYLYKHLHRAAL